MVCPSGTANSGNGLSTLCSFKLQRSAISIVRCTTPGASGKQPRHLVGALHKKLVGVEPEALGIMDLRAGLHAKHHVVRVRVLAAQVMRVVRRHQRNIQLLLQPEQPRTGSSSPPPAPGPEFQERNSRARRCPGTAAPQLWPSRSAPPASSSHNSPLRHPENPINPFAFSARYFLLTRGLR